MYDIQSVEPDLGATLLELQVLVCRKQHLERNHRHHKDIAALNFRGSKLEDLCLDFTLPGYPDYELKTNGGEIVVSASCTDGWAVYIMVGCYKYHCS